MFIARFDVNPNKQRSLLLLFLQQTSLAALHSRRVADFVNKQVSNRKVSNGVVSRNLDSCCTTLSAGRLAATVCCLHAMAVRATVLF